MNKPVSVASAATCPLRFKACNVGLLVLTNKTIANKFNLRSVMFP